MVLFVSNTDPMSNAPASTGIAEAISNAGFRVAFSDFMNETTKNCDLVLPLSHTFETWQDIEVRQGLTAFSKPVLKEKLFDTRSEGEALFELSQKIKAANNSNLRRLDSATMVYPFWRRKCGRCFASWI
ncbi:MAG: hypothetical protein R3C26_06720 [Calditrichia bacterium]